MKRIITLIVFVSVFLTNINYINAESDKYYSVDLDTVTDSIIKDNINSIYVISNKTDNYLYINNTYVERNENNEYQIDINSYLELKLSLDIENNNLKIEYVSKNIKITQSMFVFEIDSEGNQTVKFYKDKNETAFETRKASLVNDVYDFGNFEYTTDGENISFKLSVNSLTNEACLEKDGISYFQTLEDKGADRVLYFEQLFYGREVEMDYMKKDLEMVDFENAQTINYTAEQIDSAVRNEKLTLVNATTNLTHEIELCRTITQWERVSGDEVGTGEYEERLVDIQVVCQWNDENKDCDEIRESIAEKDRLFAIWADEIDYQVITLGEPKIFETEVEKKKYKNISWPSDSFKETDEYINNAEADSDYTNIKNNIADYGVIEYSLSFGEWSEYGDYSEEPDTNCTGDDCKIKTTTFYKYRSKNWSNWSEYIYDSCQEDDSTKCKSDTLYRYSTRHWNSYSDWSSSNYCGLLESDCKDESNTFFSKSTRLFTGYEIEWGDTSTSKYGDYQDECTSQYINGEPCSCKEYKTNGAMCGYSYTNYDYYSFFASLSKYNCTAITSGTHKGEYYCASESIPKSCALAGCSVYNYCSVYTCPNSKTAKYTDWSEYSDYIYSSCSNSDLTQCKSKTLYRKSYLSDWSTWSSYSYTINDTKWSVCANDSNCKQEGKILFKKQTLGEYGDYSSEELLYCPTSNDNTIYDCVASNKYQSSYRTWSTWSDWQVADETVSLNEDEKIKYRYSEGTISYDDSPAINGTYGHDQKMYLNQSKTVISIEEVEMINLIKENKTIGLLPRMKKENIEAITDEIKDNIIDLEIYNELSNGGYNNVSVADYTASRKHDFLKYEESSEELALNIFENKEVFIPYFYIRTHWRVIRTTAHVSGYDNEYLYSTNESVNEIKGEETLALKEIGNPINDDTKIIYFDYKDPLKNNDESEYITYLEVIEKLKDTDINVSKSTITISKEDMQKMKEWLKEHNNISDDYAMLLEFIYIFDSKTQKDILESIGEE